MTKTKQLQTTQIQHSTQNTNKKHHIKSPHWTPHEPRTKLHTIGRGQVIMSCFKCRHFKKKIYILVPDLEVMWTFAFKLHLLSAVYFWKLLPPLEKSLNQTKSILTDMRFSKTRPNVATLISVNWPKCHKISQLFLLSF